MRNALNKRLFPSICWNKVLIFLDCIVLVFRVPQIPSHWDRRKPWGGILAAPGFLALLDVPFKGRSSYSTPYLYPHRGIRWFIEPESDSQRFTKKRSEPGMVF
jgi:hypothetical protein